MKLPYENYRGAFLTKELRIEYLQHEEEGGVGIYAVASSNGEQHYIARAFTLANLSRKPFLARKRRMRRIARSHRFLCENSVFRSERVFLILAAEDDEFRGTHGRGKPPLRSSAPPGAAGKDYDAVFPSLPRAAGKNPPLCWPRPDSSLSSSSLSSDCCCCCCCCSTASTTLSYAEIVSGCSALQSRSDCCDTVVAARPPSATPKGRRQRRRRQRRREEERNRETTEWLDKIS
ncbi:hypothetical protein BX600DRAFT_316879 [Xylariales sp. PMI_506]|nr:hypothetical protein BX600DRAFT_316879 [Xylariales sp. PMI_506]